MKGVYAIRDNVGQTFQGGLHLFSHDAPAVRFFTDIMNAPNTIINQHPADFDLMLVASLEDELLQEHDEGAVSISEPIIAFPMRVVITGASLQQAQEARDAQAAARLNQEG